MLVRDCYHSSFVVNRHSSNMLSDGFKLLALAFTEEDWSTIHIPYFVL